jgi:transposase InsO family protein/transposase-like protein
LRGIADDLGISRGTLSDWVKGLGTGSTTAPISSPRAPLGRPESQAEKVARLEVENAQLRAEKAKIETEKSILRQAAKYFAGETNRRATPVGCRPPRHLRGGRLCEVIEVNRSSFYAWDDAAPARAERAAADAELAERIRVVHEADKAYGVPRVTAELNDGAPPQERVNHKRVARVMGAHGIAGIRLRRRVRTTVPEPSDAKAPDLLKRDFTAEEPNRKYVGDITYLPLADGHNLYLATVIDCCSRKLAGWAVADHMRTSLVADALKVALGDRGSLRGAIFHADHGAQYTSKDYAQLCDQLGVILSLGGVGTSADNALAESFNATLKPETLAGAATFTDEATCRREIFRWATRYNTRRRHSYCGYLSPNTYENQLVATIPQAA